MMSEQIKIGSVVQGKDTADIGLVMEVLKTVGTQKMVASVFYPERSKTCNCECSSLTVLCHAFDHIPRSLKDDPPKDGQPFIPILRVDEGKMIFNREECWTVSYAQQHWTHWVPAMKFTDPLPEEREEWEFRQWWNYHSNPKWNEKEQRLAAYDGWRAALQWQNNQKEKS